MTHEKHASCDCRCCTPEARRVARKRSTYFGSNPLGAILFAALPVTMQEGSLAERTAFAEATTDAAVLDAAVNAELELKLAAAGNPALARSHAATLTNDPDPQVRRALAARTDLSPNLRNKLLADPVPTVRWAAEGDPDGQPATPAEFEGQITDDATRSAARSAYLYGTLANRRRAASALLFNEEPGFADELEASTDTRVCTVLAGETPDHDQLARLLTGSSIEVAEAATVNPKFGEALGTRHDGAHAAAGSPSTTIRRAIAESTGDQRVLHRLAHDTDPGVVVAVLENPSVGRATLKSLAPASAEAAYALWTSTPKADRHKIPAHQLPVRQRIKAVRAGRLKPSHFGDALALGDLVLAKVIVETGGVSPGTAEAFSRDRTFTALMASTNLLDADGRPTQKDPDHATLEAGLADPELARFVAPQYLPRLDDLAAARYADYPDRSVRLEVARRPTTASRLLADTDDGVRRQAAVSNRLRGAREGDIISVWGKVQDRQSLLNAAAEHRTSPAVMALAARSKDPVVQMAAARSPHSSPEDLNALIRSNTSQEVRLVAGKTATQRSLMLAKESTMTAAAA